MIEIGKECYYIKNQEFIDVLPMMRNNSNTYHVLNLKDQKIFDADKVFLFEPDSETVKNFVNLSLTMLYETLETNLKIMIALNKMFDKNIIMKKFEDIIINNHNIGVYFDIIGNQGSPIYFLDNSFSSGYEIEKIENYRFGIETKNNNYEVESASYSKNEVNLIVKKDDRRIEISKSKKGFLQYADSRNRYVYKLNILTKENDALSLRNYAIQNDFYERLKEVNQLSEEILYYEYIYRKIFRK